MKKVIEAKKEKQQIISVSLILEDFKSEQVAKRLNSVKNIKVICSALGSQRTRNQFIPFVVAELVEDEDEVLEMLLQRIFEISQALGGTANNVYLIPIFEALIQIETTPIRQKATDRFEEAMAQLDLKKNEEIIMKSIKRIDLLEFVQTKQALARLIVLLLPTAGVANQNELLNIYLKLASQEFVQIRKYAARYSKELVKCLQTNQAPILKIIEILFKNESKSESINISLIDTLIQLCKYKQQAYLLPLFNLVSYQFTWRVRYQLISKIKELAQSMGKQNFRSFFLPLYIKYLNDVECQIKSISCVKILEVCEYLQAQDIIAKILPALKNLHTDPQVYVRNALAKNILFLCNLVGKKATTDHILPRFLQLLKDEDSQVRVSIFANINQITKVLGIQTMSQTIIPALSEISTNKNWRIRMQSLSVFLYLAKGLGLDFMNQKNMKIYLDLLKDRVFTVRKRTIEVLKDLIQIYGATWVEKNLFSKILPFQKVTNYLTRETLIFAIQTVAFVLSPEYLNKTLIPIIVSLSSDSVENIRYNICRVIGIIFSRSKQTDLLRKTLKLLKEDKDIDVKSMAMKVEKEIQAK